MHSVLLQKSSTVRDCPLAWAAKLTNCRATGKVKVYNWLTALCQFGLVDNQ